MSDPISKIGSSISEKVIAEAQKQSSGVSGGSSFAEVLNEKMDKTDRSGGLREQILQAFGMGRAEAPGAPVQSISAEGLDIEPARISAGQEIRTQGKVLDLLTEVNRGALQMDNLVDLIGSGRSMSPQSLLAIQANLSVNVLQMELFKSVVEQGNTGVKTLLNTNFA